MNSDDEHLDGEELPADSEANAEHDETEPARSSWIIRTIQILLAGILISLVTHGVLPGSRTDQAHASHHNQPRPADGENIASASYTGPTTL